MFYFDTALSVFVLFSFVFLEKCTCYSASILEKARLERQNKYSIFILERQGWVEGAHSTVTG